MCSPRITEWGLTFVEQLQHFLIGKKSRIGGKSAREEKKKAGGGLKQISAAERQIVSSAVDVSDSYLARLDPALPLLTSKSEPGDDGNRK